MSGNKIILFLLVFPIALLAQQGNSIKDPLGRTVILHGLNTSSSAKHSVDHQPWVNEADVEREYTDFGFNTVRYLIFWGAIEPEKDKIDTAYLQQVKKRVEWYTSRKMLVILDMHQDVYGYGVGGNGAPVWASTQTKRQNVIPDKWAWWLQNLEPKVIHSYVQFFKYKKKQDQQQHYIATWLKVVELFKDNPYVIGYDLMNEPHGGKLGKTLLGGFERKWLGNFYKRLIPAIRAVDTTRYIFFEPRSFGVNFGMKSHLRKVNDVGANKLVYSPHCYMRFVDVGGDYKKKDYRSLSKWYKHRDKEVKMHQSGFLIGEFGLSPNKKDFDKYLRDIFSQADARNASWTYWASDLGGWGPLDGNRNPTPILNELLRVYPQAVSGNINTFNYDPVSRLFSFEYTSNAAIIAPTIISVSRKLYPTGYNYVVSGTPNYSTVVDPVTNALQIIVRDDKAVVKVEISPK